jgi:hypothetical protein
MQHVGTGRLAALLASLMPDDPDPTLDPAQDAEPLQDLTAPATVALPTLASFCRPEKLTTIAPVVRFRQDHRMQSRTAHWLWVMRPARMSLRSRLAMAAASAGVSLMAGGGGSVGMVWLSLVLGQGRPAPGAGTSIPVARKRSCENGPELGKTETCQYNSLTRPQPDVHDPPSWRVLAFLWFWVQLAPVDLDPTNGRSRARIERLASLPAKTSET